MSKRRLDAKLEEQRRKISNIRRRRPRIKQIVMDEANDNINTQGLQFTV